MQLNSDKFLNLIIERRKTSKVVGERMWHVITGDRFMTGAYSPLCLSFDNYYYYLLHYNEFNLTVKTFH